MAQSVIEAARGEPCGLSDTKTEQLPCSASLSEYNLTSLSIAQACLLNLAVAALIWASIAYILVR